MDNKGTAPYMAPELFSGTTPPQLQHKRDVYAMGITLCELFTGTVPYENMTFPQLFIAVPNGVRPVILVG
jgi:serine/threonine protein kinase